MLLILTGLQFTNYKLFISIAPIQQYNNWLSRSLYIQQLISTSEITTYTHNTAMGCHLHQCYHGTQSYYPDSEPTSPCPIRIMPSIRLGQVSILKSMVCPTSVQTCDFGIRTHEVQIPWSPSTGGGGSTHLAISPYARAGEMEASACLYSYNQLFAIW